MIRHSRSLVIAALFVGFCAAGSFAQEDRIGLSEGGRYGQEAVHAGADHPQAA